MNIFLFDVFGYEVNAENVALAFTILFLVFVVLGGLQGFLRGTKKSIFYLIVAALVFGLGFGLMSIAIDALLTMPIGQYVQNIGFISSRYPEVNASSSAEDIILGMIASFVPNLADAVAKGSVTSSFVMGIVGFVIKLVYIVTLLSLAFTVFKILADIIWLIFFRPKKKKDGKKKKKTFGSRMLGFGIGSAKGAVYALLLFTLIAGIASIGTSLMSITGDSGSTETEAVLVLTNDNATLITLDASSSSSSSSANSLYGDVDIEFLMSILGAYRDSIPGQLYENIQIATVPIDEYLFDGVFSFDVKMSEDNVVNVSLRKEIATVAGAIADVANEFDLQNVTLQSILEVGEEGEKALRNVVDAIGELSILKVAIPVALEVALYSDVLVDSEGNKILGELFTPEQIPEVSEALIGDICNIGYTLIDARSLISTIIGEEDSDINTYLNMDPIVIKTLFDEDHLGGLDTIDILAPIGITYLTTMEGIRNALDEFGLSISDITDLEEGNTWAKEIGKIGDVYIAIQDLLKDPATGKVAIDTDNWAAIIDLLSEEKINNFVDTLFSCNLIKNSAGALVTYVTNTVLTDDIKKFINIDNGITFDANECKAFLNSATYILQSGILDGDFSAALKNMDLEGFAYWLAQSEIIRGSLASSMDMLLGEFSTEDSAVRFGTFDDWDDPDCTERELLAILRTLKAVGVNLFGEDGESKGLSLDIVTGLSEKEIDTLLSSQILSKTIVNFVVDNGCEGGTLELVADGVNKVNANTDNWYDTFHINETVTLNGSSLTIKPKDASIDEAYGVCKYLIYVDGEYLTSVRTTAGATKSVDLSKVVIGKDEKGNPTYYTPSSTFTYTAYGVNVNRMGVEPASINGTYLTINPNRLSLDNDVNKVNKYNVYVNNEFLCSVRVDSSQTTGIDLSQIVVGKDKDNNDVFFKLNKDDKIEVYGYNEGELRKLFMAVLSITSHLDGGSLDFSNTDSITSALSKISDEDIANVTYSVIINEALISAIENLASEGESQTIYIPTELKNTAGKIDHDKWNDANETYYILKAIKSIFNGASIDAESLKIKKIIDAKDDVLKSKVICETVKQNIIKVEGIDVPESEGLGVDDLTGWANTYDSHGNKTSDGELSVLLDVICIIINIDDNTTINSISVDNLKLSTIIDRCDDILKSKIICETVRVKLLEVEGIDIPEGEDLSTTSLDGWKNTYNADGSVNTRGEISNILNSISYVLNITDSTSIDSISTDSFKLGSIIDNTDEILKSLIISETIRVKLTSAATGITIPEDEGLSTTNLEGWKNTYDENGNVLTHGEIACLLTSINYVLDLDDNDTIDSLNFESIKIKNIVDHRDDILKSIVITNTIKDKLLEVEGIDIPDGEGLSLTGLDGWKNVYDGNDNLTERGEISHLLEVISVVLNINNDTSFTSLSTNDIKVKNIIDNSDEVLLSLVLSETIRVKLSSVSGIEIPENEGLASDNLTGWKNVYDANDDVVSHGEIASLLTAIEVMINPGDEDTINSISVDNVSLKHIIDNCDDILKSLVLCETIRVKICDVETIEVPEDAGLSKTSLTGWKNVYNEDEIACEYGEIEYLLKALDAVLKPDENTKLDNIAVNINVGNIIEGKDIILHSKVLTETIKGKIIDAVAGGTTLKLPENYDVASSTNPNYVLWGNEYTDTYSVVTQKITFTVDAKGELDALLSSIGDLLTNTNCGFDEIGNLDFSKLFDPIVQKDIISSKIISETIIEKLESISALSIPSDTTHIDLVNIYDRTDWWNLETGELVYFLNSIDSVLSDEQKSSLDNIELDVDTIFSSLTNETKRTKLLESYVIADTLMVNFRNLDSLTLPTAANAGVDLANSSDAWYTISDDRSSVGHYELWNLITSIQLLLGDSFSSSTNFTMNQLLENASFIPTLNSEKENTNTTVHTFLQSKLIEEVFVGLVKDILIDGVMKDYINAPEGGYVWYEYHYITNEADEYDLQTIIESLYQMENAGLGYATFGTGVNVAALSSLDVAKLADAFVISRTFRCSIEKALNGIIQPVYSVAYTVSLYTTPIEPWNDVKLDQSEYNPPVTKKDASSHLKNKLDKIINNIKSVY